MLVFALLAGTARAGDGKLPAPKAASEAIVAEGGNPVFAKPSSLKDNGDGTVTDNNTGLTWEKKDNSWPPNDSDLHNVNNIYPWSGTCSTTGARCGVDADCRRPRGQTCTATDGQGGHLTIFKWLAELNAANFAGHSDWRIPTVSELQTIVDYGTPNPSVGSAFDATDCESTCKDHTGPACGCRAWPAHWSAATVAPGPGFARDVNFGGFVLGFDKGGFLQVRAVRAAR